MSASKPHQEPEWRELVEWIDAALSRIEADYPHTPSLQDIQFAQRTVSELAGVVRGLEEQLEAAQTRLERIRQLCAEGHGDDLIAETTGVPYPASDSVPSLREQLEAAQHERSVACSWAAELASEKRALQASVEIIQQERDGLLAQVRDHCSRPPGVCYPASEPEEDA